MRIFLLEDDLSLRKGMSFKLSHEGHDVLCADSVTQANTVIEKPFDLAIIDINLPDGSGLDICKMLREGFPETYILLLTANDTESDIVTGYDFGADDYVTKPFSLSVLLSKVSAVERRHNSSARAVKTQVLNASKQTVTIQGCEISLTRNEWRLLHKLYENEGQIVTKEQLLEALWDIDGDFVNENTLAVNIRRLREKIEPTATEDSAIENIRGVGYRLRGNLERE